MAIGFDDFDRLIRPIVREVATGLEAIRIAAVVTVGKGKRRPEKLIDRVKIQFGIDDVGMIFG